MSSTPSPRLPAPMIAPTADVDATAVIGDGTSIWHLAQIRDGARIGTRCVIGRGAYVDADVVVGNNCKIQNFALVYAPAVLEDGVFVGPAAVLTNDTWPRAVNSDGTLKSATDWAAAGAVVRQGAAVGARAVILPGVEVGRWSTIGAGAVVTKDVSPFALVVGAPARRIGWVGFAGVRLEAAGMGVWKCPQDGSLYQETDGILEPRT